MAEVNGTTFIVYQGETLDISFPVVDDTEPVALPYNLTGGAAVLSYVNRGGTAVNVTCSIATTTVSASLSHAVTQGMLGAYEYQLMCRNSAGKIVMTVEGQIEVKWSINPDAVAP